MAKNSTTTTQKQTHSRNKGEESMDNKWQFAITTAKKKARGKMESSTPSFAIGHKSLVQWCIDSPRRRKKKQTRKKRGYPVLRRERTLRSGEQAKKRDVIHDE